MDRQSIVQNLIEGSLRAAADPSVTAVLRGWDYYPDGSVAQPLLPYLIVSVTDDRELGISFGLYTATVTVTLAVDWSQGVRDDFDRIRESVRQVMHALPGLSAAGVTLDGILETACSDPTEATTDGDVILTQVLTHSLWFTAPVTPDAILEQELFLVDRAEDGTVYTTTQAADPRRITRWSGSLLVSYGYGNWADRATLVYTSPVTPPPTATPQPVT